MGVLFVAAAGNGSAEAPEFPANLKLDSLLSVGATTPDDTLASFSDRGALVAAPGVGILSTTAPGRYERYDVPFEQGQTVLDGLRWIRVHHDPTLAIRFSCINANACKECMIHVDGKRQVHCSCRGWRSLDNSVMPRLCSGQHSACC